MNELVYTGQELTDKMLGLMEVQLERGSLSKTCLEQVADIPSCLQSVTQPHTAYLLSISFLSDSAVLPIS